MAFLHHLRACSAEALKPEPLHAIQPMLREQGVIEKVVFGGHFTPLDCLLKEIVPISSLTFVPTKPHQSDEVCCLGSRAWISPMISSRVRCSGSRQRQRPAAGLSRQQGDQLGGRPGHRDQVAVKILNTEVRPIDSMPAA